jgi:hypothetical protein
MARAFATLPIPPGYTSKGAAVRECIALYMIRGNTISKIVNNIYKDAINANI